MDYSQALNVAVAAAHLSSAARDNILLWLTEPKYIQYRPVLEKLIVDKEWQRLEDSFFKVVPFGTGGRRGTVGIGSNRINNVTIGESVQGLANYLLKQDVKPDLPPKDLAKQDVVIGYDTRLTSVEFAQLTASVFAANGFKVYLFEGCRATPELSFAVRHFKAAAGVVISASHNPPSDNGLKAYWSDGGQIVPPHDTGIMAEVSAVTEIKTTDYTTAVRRGSINLIGSEVDTAYVRAVVNESLVPTRSAHIVYSPLHGTGSTSVLLVLRAAGFGNLTIVEEQSTPDGNFPNIKNNIPNPEVRDASDLVTEYARREEADVAITTDPDADRLGVVARDGTGEYQFFNGNQIAALLGYYVLSTMAAQGKLTPKHFIVKTIVTTDFLKAMADDFGVQIYDNILIGFKFVAELIRTLENEEEFIFGGEESHGILKGSYTRDKDAAVAALLIAELVSILKDQGKTLSDQLNDLYRRYGMYWETLQNIQYPGAAGSATMQKLMTGLRGKPPQALGEMTVIRSIDRLAEESEGMKGDVLIYHLADDGQTRVTVRPSGTEPKLKVYIQIHQPLPVDASDQQIEEAVSVADGSAKKVAAAMQVYFETILAS